MINLSRRRFVGSVAAIGASALMSPAFAMRNVLSASGTGYAYHPDFESFENNGTETYLRAQWINSRLVASGVSGETVPISPYGDPISCGFDLKKYDGLGQFFVTAQGVSRITNIVKQIADTYAGGKLVSMLEGGYLDSPRDQSIQGSGNTFSGLSQCAENHIKTLMTGIVQSETPFYAGSTAISMKNNASKKSLGKEGKILGLSDDGPQIVTITDPSGKIIRKTETLEAPMRFDTKGIAPGRYIVSIKKNNKTISRSITLGL